MCTGGRAKSSFELCQRAHYPITHTETLKKIAAVSILKHFQPKKNSTANSLVVYLLVGRWQRCYVNHKNVTKHCQEKQTKVTGLNKPKENNTLSLRIVFHVFLCFTEKNSLKNKKIRVISS